jgi:hypothetical protein
MGLEWSMSLTTQHRFRSAWTGEAAAIDVHKELYGMSADEFEFLDEACPVCGNRLDQFGWCGHGNIGGD